MATQLEQFCNDHGLRMSDQRRAILRVIEEARDHPSVEQLYRRVASLVPDISMATVYRTLKVLTDAGLLARLDFGDGRIRYEVARSDHHEHLFDISTSAIVEFQSSDIEGLIREIAHSLGYDVVEYRLEVFGEPHLSSPHRAKIAGRRRARSVRQRILARAPSGA